MLMIAAILIPVAAGIVISAVPMEDRTRKILYMCSVLLTDIAAVFAAMSGGTLRLSELSEGVAIIFRADTLGRCFLAVTILLYTCVLFYSFEYMKMEERIPTFYAFYLISMGALIAECFAGNLVTMYLSFEFLTLTSMPLVLHERTKEAVAAGLKYLFYSVAGAMMGLLAIFFVYHVAKNPELFVYGGFMDPSKYTGEETVLLAAVGGYCRLRRQSGYVSASRMASDRASHRAGSRLRAAVRHDRQGRRSGGDQACIFLCGGSAPAGDLGAACLDVPRDPDDPHGKSQEETCLFHSQPDLLYHALALSFDRRGFAGRASACVQPRLRQRLPVPGGRRLYL